MKILNIKRIEKAKHICRYDLEYETEDKRIKKYEIVSRDRHLHSLEDLQSWSSKTVVIIAINKENGKLLLNREFRMAAGDWIYNFPSGMIDPGETPSQAAKRELEEETGLIMERRLYRMKSSYNAVGITNETSSVVLAEVSGEIVDKHNPFEEIEAGWYSKEEVKELLKNSKMSARAQMFGFVWVYGELQIEKLVEEFE